MDDHLIDIDKYLDNNMSPDERKAFEERLRTDKELTEEVAFQKELKGFFENRNPQLRQDLKDLGAEFIVEEKKTGSSPYWIWGSLFVLIAIGFYGLYFSTSTSIVSDTPSQQTEQQNNTPQDVPSTIEEIAPEQTTPNTPKDNNESTEERTIDVDDIPEDQPIASLDNKERFVPNDLVEGIIQERYRAEEEDPTTVTLPEKDATFKYQKLIPLKINGQTTIAPNYQLAIYSNETSAIENDYPLLKTALQHTVKDGVYTFKFNGEIPLDKGLYYLFIRQADTFEVLYVSRFTVN